MYLTLWQPLLECIFRQIYLHITSWLNGIYLLELLHLFYRDQINIAIIGKAIDRRIADHYSFLLVFCKVLVSCSWKCYDARSQG